MPSSFSGYKVALLGAAAQKRLGADGPVWARLTADMEIVDGAPFDTATVASAKAEVELVYRLGSDLIGPGVTEFDVRDATRAVHVGIEIPAVRLGYQPPNDLKAYLEQNALAMHYVLGPAASDFQDIDLSLAGAIVEVNGEVVASGAGARVLGDPARSVAWLANRLAADGIELLTGALIFSGALAEPVDLRPDQVVTVEIAHVGRATLRTV